MTIKLYVNKKRISKNVNNLVAMAFIPNPKKLTDVNHKNHNKCDNRPSNLEWVSHKDNIIDMNNFYNIHRGTHSKYKHYKNGSYLHKCQKCGNLCDKNAKYCIKCYNKLRQNQTYDIQYVQQLLYEYNGNFSKVGLILNRSASSISHRLKKHKLPYHSKDYQ